jgi:peptidoglycan hydrolase CwlO-like protein
MRKVVILSTLCILMAAFCLNGYADDLSYQISALEQKAERVQNQVNQAKQQTDAQLGSQVKSIQASVDSLVQQRVQLDSHIAKLESQMEDLRRTSNVALSRQLKSYDSEMAQIKQEMSSLLTAKKEQPAANAPAATGTVNTPVPALGN